MCLHDSKLVGVCSLRSKLLDKAEDEEEEAERAAALAPPSKSAGASKSDLRKRNAGSGTTKKKAPASAAERGAAEISVEKRELGALQAKLVRMGFVGRLGIGFTSGAFVGAVTPCIFCTRQALVCLVSVALSNLAHDDVQALFCLWMDTLGSLFVVLGASIVGNASGTAMPHCTALARPPLY